jgi:Fe-S oxidoreductase
MLYEALDLCVGCKACRRECPTGVDMARMKIEFLSTYRALHGVPLRERLFAYLPRYAPRLSRLGPLSGATDWRPVRWLMERLVGVSASRSLPAFIAAPPRSSRQSGHLARSSSRGSTSHSTGHSTRRVALFVDTFSRYFEPETAHAAVRVLEAAGYDVEPLEAPPGERPLCCGRTFLSAGLTDEARVEGERLLAATMPLVRHGVPVVGIEPSCLLTLRDELPALLPGAESESLSNSAMLFEELLMAGIAAGHVDLELGPLPTRRALVHGHCHRKAFGALVPMIEALRLIPGLRVDPIEAGCCGMAGSFGYEAEHLDVSLRMAELALLPQIRQAEPDTWIVADGTSCRRQILDGTGHEAIHPAVVLARALSSAEA